MKRYLKMILILVLVFSLGACNSASDTEYITREEFETYKLVSEERIAASEERADIAEDTWNRMVWQGYMLPEGSLDEDLDASIDESFYVSRMGYQYLMITDKDKVDYNKFPDYIWDEFEAYIGVEELTEMLVNKYLGINADVNVYSTYTIRIIKPTEMTQDDFLVRLSMMIVELGDYDFYTLDSDWLYIQTDEGASQHITVKMSLLNTEAWQGSLVPSMIWSGEFDTKLAGLSSNLEAMQILYDQYEIDGTFSESVLPNY